MKDRLHNNDNDHEDTKSISNSNLSVHSSNASSKERHYCELDENGEMVCRQLTSYECKLEDDVEQLQDALFRITSHYAKIQFRLRQIATASGCERMCLLKELERMTSQDLDNCKDHDIGSEMPSLASDSQSLGNVRVKQHKILTQLRGRLLNLADAAGTCFQTESGGCYNLSRCACQKIKKGVEIAKLPIFDDDGNLIVTRDQGCHCCSCKARVAQQGKCGAAAGTAVGNETGDCGFSPGTPSGRRYLSETFSDTDYGREDMEQAKLKAAKKKKSKSGKKKSTIRPKKQPQIDYEDYGSAGDRNSPQNSSTSGRSRVKRISTPHHSAKSKSPSRTPSRATDRTLSRSSSPVKSRITSRAPSRISREFYNGSANETLVRSSRAASSIRLPGQISILGSIHSPARSSQLLPNSSKSEPIASRRRTDTSQRPRQYSNSRTGSPRGESRRRCPAVCRTNRSCQKRYPNKGIDTFADIKRSPSKGIDVFADIKRRERGHSSDRGQDQYDSSTEHSETVRAATRRLRNRHTDDAAHLKGHLVYEKSQRHLFNQIIGDNPSLKKENEADSNEPHDVTCTCCTCIRRIAQDFGISSGDRTSKPNVGSLSNHNKPVIVVKSSTWVDMQEEKAKDTAKKDK